MADEQYLVDPLSFFAWDEFVDPGKPHECLGCGALLDEECVEWNKEQECILSVWMDCGTMNRLAPETLSDQ